MAGSYPGAVVAVEIFMKGDEIAPVGIGLKFLRCAEDRPAFIRPAQKDPHQPPGDFARNLPQISHPAGTRRALHLVAIAQIEMKFLQGLDEQEIDREPDRSTPVRVAAEEAGGGLGRLVVYSVVAPVDRERIRVSEMMAGEGANAVRGKELLFVQHVAQHSTQPVWIDDG